METVKCLIIGSGPAGYTAALYLGRANIQAVLIEGLQTGGQLMTTTEIENFPGYPEGVTPSRMMDDIRSQALRFGADMRPGVVVKAVLDRRPFVVTLDSGEQWAAQSIIIATGATPRYLGLPSETRFKGYGVSACATCDGFFYRGKEVAVVGGGDTACEEAVYLSGICSKVYMIVRRDVFRASKTMQERVFNTPNIEILWQYRTKELLGDEGGLTGVRLIHQNGTEKVLALQGFFLAIGHHPNSELFTPMVKTDEQGFIITEGKTTRTSVPGVFAAGDVQDPLYRQAVTAAASGCMAALDVDRYLAQNNI